MTGDGGRLVGPRRQEAIIGLLAATLGSTTVSFLAYAPCSPRVLGGTC